MDKEQLLRLERAGMDLMSPPNAVSDERRKEAEALFMELRNSKLPYGVCKFALENSQSDFVQFQAASTIREASMREWSVLPLEEKTALRGYIVQFLTAHPNLMNYVRSQLLHTVAVMVKRATLEEDHKKLFDSVLSTVSQLLATDDHKMRHLGCSLLSALIVEYSSSTGSSNIGMPLEFHSQCKKAIEEEVLLRFLLLAAQILQHYPNADWASLSREDHSLLSGFLNISSQILNWDFHNHLDKMIRFVLITAKKSDVVHLKPPRTYASTFLDPNFVLLFLKLLSKVHESEDQTHHVIQCLTQLASLSKPVFETEVERQTYLLNFVSGVLEYVSASSSMSQQEVYGLSCILRRLATTFSANQFSQLGAERLELLVRFLAQLTCLSAQKTALEEEEEGLTYQESLEHFLEVWVSFLCGWTVHDSATDSMTLDPSYKALLTQPLLEVFNAYIQSKISAPRGWRVAKDVDSDEIVEIEEDDRVAYADELLSIGYISRTLADHTIPILVNLLDQCTSECLQLLVMIKQDAQVLNSQQNNLDSLYEDLHWLTMITGYTLCQVEKEKVTYIPSEIMQYSITKHKAAKAVENGSNSLALGGGNEAAAFLQGEGGSGVDVSSMDLVVALVLSVCRLCNLEKAFISNGLIDVLSPQLCDTVVWCLAQLVGPYLMLDENCYQEVSLPLISAFGQDSKSAEWLTVFLTEIATFNLSVWSSEDKLCVSSVELFNNLVRQNKSRTAIVAQCDVVWSLMRSFSSGQEPVASLPPKLQRILMLSLLSCEAGERQQQFTTELLQPFHDRFMLLVQRDDFRSVSQDSPIQLTLLGILDALCGLVEARKSEHFQFLLPFLQVCVSLMEVYSGASEVITVILNLFSLVAKYFVVWFESNIENVEQQLCDLYRRLIQTYAKNNIGKYSKLAIVEEEQCEDLLLFVELLDHHTTILEEVGDQLIPESKEQLMAVLVDGVCLLLSFVNEELLKFLSLCEKIFSLFNHICIASPNIVATLSSDAQFSFVRLVELGLTNYGPEVCHYSLESVWHLARHYENSPHLHTLTPLTQSLQHFLKIIFELLLSSSFDMELLTSAAGATFTLVHVMKDYFSLLVKEILSSHSSDAQAHGRLLDAFQQLTVDKHDFNSYQRKLEQFLPFVKGVLYYK